MAIARLSMKVGKAGKAAPHAAYIARAGQYAERLERGEKLEATEAGGMPAWAQSTPLAFWQAADAYERKGGTTYREMEIALPRELLPEQRAALVREFVRQEIGERHAYQWAIHTPRAVDGGEQPHLHLMFSERQRDGIERDPEQYFKRYNAKNPERGGARKGYGPSAGQTLTRAERTAELKELRGRWQAMCNTHLAQAGFEQRIDMRSHAEQGIDREPERKQLPSQWRGAGRATVIEFRQARAELAKASAELARAVPDARAEVIDLQAERERRRAVVQVEDRTPEAAPDPLERWREAVAQAERGGDKVELVLRRAELAAAAALVAQDKPPTHHLDKIREAGKAAALAYLRGDSAPAEPRRGPESGDRQAGGATGRVTPERPAVDAVAAFRAELEREQQRRDAERQAEREWQAEIERRAKLAAAPEQRERQRLERMSSRELAAEIAKLRPPPVRDLVERDPAVIEADQQRRDLMEQHQDACTREAMARHEAEQWRQAHPLRAKAHDSGLFRSAYLDERAKIEAEARQEWLTVAPRIEDAALRGRQARSDAEVRITVEQMPIRAKVAELEALQKEKARQEREAEAKRLAQKRIEREREAVPKDFKLMAQKREMKASGWSDRGERWKAAPEPLKKLIDGYNAAPKEMRPAILDRILSDGQRREHVRELLAEQRQQYRANDRGMSL